VSSDIEALVLIDTRIDAADRAGLRGRWEFGRAMLAARDGAGRLPNGFLAELVVRTGKSRAELGHRARFAARYPTEQELAHAVSEFGSWREVVAALAIAPDAGADPGPIPAGRFATIVADPPWTFTNTATRAAAQRHYPTMTLEEIAGLDVAQHAADKAHAYLWVPSALLPDGLQVLAAWGFEYRAVITWVKPQLGLGNYFRSTTELALFGVRGGMRTRDRSLPTHFTAPRGRHSAKPAEFQELVMRASPGPYLELFARCSGLADCTCSRCRLGWAVWGNEALSA